MISKSKKEFENFNPKFYVAGCIIEHNGKILLLKYPDNKKDNPGKWGSSAGKVDLNETSAEAIVREVFEETGLNIDSKKLKFIERTYDRYPKFDFVYDVFKYVFDSTEKPRIVLSDEHVAYQWITPKDALNEDLVLDEDYCIKRAFDLE
jgi:dihydroneopterin triphosphate diphosphatase